MLDKFVTDGAAPSHSPRGPVKSAIGAGHLVTFYLAFLAAAGFGPWTASYPSIAITLWPPNGVFIAALIMTRRSAWPSLVGTACLAELTGNALWFGNSLPLATTYFAINAVESLIAAVLLRPHFPQPVNLANLRQVAALVLLGACLAPMIGATLVGILDSQLGRHDFLIAWRLWWLGDATGILIAMPLSLVVCDLWARRSEHKIGEALIAVLSVASVLIVGAVAFASNLQAAYLVLLPLLWVAIRLDFKGVIPSLALVTVLAAGFSVAGIGHFSGRGAAEQQLHLQIFLAVLVSSSLLVAAIARQYRETLGLLKAINVELETRVAERTAALSKSETSLARERERLAVALRAGRLGVYEWRLDTNEVWWSPETYDVYGVDARKFVPSVDTFGALVHPDDRAELWQRTQACLEDHDVFEHEYRIVRPDGTGRWVANRSHVTFDADGRAAGIIGVAVDVTERRQSEQALRDSEERFRAFMTHSPMAAWIVGEDDRIRYASPGYYRLFAVENDITGLHIGEIYGAALAAVYAENNELARRSERPVETIERGVRRDGSVGQFLVSKFAIRMPSGELLVGNTAIDVTDMKKSEQTARESEERLRLAAEAADFGYYDIDITKSSVYWSERMRSILGVGPDEPTAPLGRVPAFVHPDDRKRVEEELSAALDPAGSGLIDSEHRVITLDGAVRWIALKGLTRFVEGGGRRTPVRASGVIIDVSVRRRHEEHISLLLREVNHRSKNMLTLVHAIARQTAARSPGEFIQRFGERIQALAASQDLLIDNDWRAVSLRGLITSQLEHFADAVKSRVRIDGPAIELGASAAQALGMSIHELGTNAAKYGALSVPYGRVDISWRLDDIGDGARFTMTWRESGGPPVAPPMKKGFGSTVLKELVERSLDGGATIAYRPEGLTWQVTAPADAVKA